MNGTNNPVFQVEDPLSEAVKFLKPLQTFCSDNIETHLQAFEIYYRKGRLYFILFVENYINFIVTNDTIFTA